MAIVDEWAGALSWWKSSFFFLSFFFLLNEAIFSSIQRRIGPINQHSTVPWLSFPSLQIVGENDASRIPKNSGYDLSGRWNRFCLLWSRFAGFSPLFRLFFRFWCVMVDPCFVNSDETPQKLFRIALKHVQKCFEVVMRFHFCSTVSKRTHSSRRQLFHVQCFV